MTAQPTTKQRHCVAAMIAKTAEPVTYEEASRLIRDLKRVEMALPRLLEEIAAADRAGDRDRLGRLLRQAPTRIRHGDWLPTLRKLGIHPWRAQRLIAHATSSYAKGSK